MAINKTLAIRLAKVCMWAYDFSASKKAELLTFRRKLPERLLKIADKEAVHTSYAAVAEYSDIVVVAFQGTISDFGLDGEFEFASLVDWIQNFRVEQVAARNPTLPGLVHEGFFRQLQLIADDVVSALSATGDKPIVVTGHSQGGAIAALATKMLEDQGYPVRESYTFASPRVGDPTFARSVRTAVHRVEYGDDIVPHLPPSTAQKSVLDKSLSSISRLFQLPDALLAMQDLSRRLKSLRYTGVGRLTYRAQGDAPLLEELDRSQERTLFTRRKQRLLIAGRNLVEHHHLPHYIAMFKT